MAESLDHISRCVKNELEESKVFYQNALKTDLPLLKDVIDYLLKQKGKQVRPLIILLSASMHGKISDLTYLSSTAIEMLHTATLVHDDVVDGADERRGMKSVNALWRSKVAVLVGDYLLSQALMLVTKNRAYDLLDLMTLPIRMMSEGELLQIEKSRSLDTTEETYFEIIKKKTAVLIAACAGTGAKSVGACDAVVEQMMQVGEFLGIAFQIRDDIFDFEKTNFIGKPTGNDIVERKITLPLIYSLKKVSSKEQKQVFSLVENASKNRKNIDIVRNFVKQHNGLDYAVDIANQYRDKAISILKQFPDIPAQKSMIELAFYITDRNK